MYVVIVLQSHTSNEDMAADENRQRRPYNHVSNQDRTCIIAAFLGEDGNYLEVARTLGSSGRWPAQSWLSTCGTTGGILG